MARTFDLRADPTALEDVRPRSSQTVDLRAGLAAVETPQQAPPPGSGSGTGQSGFNTAALIGISGVANTSTVGNALPSTDFNDIDDLNDGEDEDTDDELDGTDGRDRIKIHNGDDTVDAGDGNDVIYDLAGGDDTIEGGDGDDTFVAGTGVNSLDGGAGIDTVTYQYSGVGAVVSLGEPGQAGSGTASGQDTILDIERVTGSNFGDQLTGNSLDNILLGLDGDDVLRGLAGNDYILGGAGADMIEGGVGEDHLRGDDGADLLFGGDNADRLEGGADNDYLDGGAGSDDLRGDHGNDHIVGGEGDDVLVGGLGNDRLDGGAGSDVFRFTGTRNENGYDTIVGFEQGVDKIDLSQIDADLTTAGHQRFEMNGGDHNYVADYPTERGGGAIESGVHAPWYTLGWDWTRFLAGSIETRIEDGYTYVYLNRGEADYVEAEFVLVGEYELDARDFIL